MTDFPRTRNINEWPSHLRTLASQHEREVGRYTVSNVRKDFIAVMEEVLLEPPFEFTVNQAKEKVRDITTFLLAAALEGSHNEQLINTMWKSGRELREHRDGITGSADVLRILLEQVTHQDTDRDK